MDGYRYVRLLGRVGKVESPVRRGAVSGRGLALAVAIAVTATWHAPSMAQHHWQPEDSTTVVVGARYDAGPVKRMLLGSGYRSLWMTPVTLPVLSPDTAANGLVALRRGNSEKTTSLLFMGADSLEYFFRSVDKNQASTLHSDFRGTLVAQVIQDMVSAKHPGAAIVAAALLQAAGVEHPSPRLAVMADHPLLGEHRDGIAGLIGMFEERPEEGLDGAKGFRGYERIIGSDRLFERLNGSSDDRVDAVAYLAARLMDVMIGDWDRHPDQWRWALVERDGVRYWRAIPRDRDNAFSDVRGAISRVANLFQPTFARYEAAYPELYGLVHNAQALDRRILPHVPGAVWDSIAVDLRNRLTDDVIADAVGRLPDEWERIDGVSLATKLRARRDALPDVARRLYDMMTSEVDVHGTDGMDAATIERMPDGSVRVQLASLERGDIVYFDRVFHPSETREVRVDLHGGADRAIVHGRGGEITVRVLGGDGNDRLVDESVTTGDAVTAFYDHSGDDTIVTVASTHVDRRAPRDRSIRALFEEHAPPARDWGVEGSLITPRFGWTSEVGPVIGVGPRWVRFGFRRGLYMERVNVALRYAPLHNRVGVDADWRLPRTRSGSEIRLSALGSGIEVTRFHGFGNNTESVGDADDYLVWATEYAVAAELFEDLGGVDLSIGPIVRQTQPDPVAGSPGSIPGTIGRSPFGVGGVQAALRYDRGDLGAYPTRGVKLELSADGYPVTWGDAESAFARGGVWAAGYLPIPVALDPVIAVRVGANHVTGDAPFQYSPTVGGSSTLRGFRNRRYTGDTSLNAGMELRARIARINFGLVRAQVGGIALIDAGRVFVSGEDDGSWHYGKGGGLWFGILDRALTAHLVYADGEKGGLYAGLGMPF